MYLEKFQDIQDIWIKTIPNIDKMETKSLEEIREDANNFAEALSLEYYLIGNKNKSNADLILLYEKYKHLSREETILFIGSTLNYSSDAEQKENYLICILLYYFFEGQYLSDINNQILHNEKMHSINMTV